MSDEDNRFFDDNYDPDEDPEEEEEKNAGIPRRQGESEQEYAARLNKEIEARRRPIPPTRNMVDTIKAHQDREKASFKELRDQTASKKAQRAVQEFGNKDFTFKKQDKKRKKKKDPKPPSLYEDEGEETSYLDNLLPSTYKTNLMLKEPHRFSEAFLKKKEQERIRALQKDLGEVIGVTTGKVFPSLLLSSLQRAQASELARRPELLTDPNAFGLNQELRDIINEQLANTSFQSDNSSLYKGMPRGTLGSSAGDSSDEGFFLSDMRNRPPGQGRPPQGKKDVLDEKSDVDTREEVWRATEWRNHVRDLDPIFFDEIDDLGYAADNQDSATTSILQIAQRTDIEIWERVVLMFMARMHLPSTMTMQEVTAKIVEWINRKPRKTSLKLLARFNRVFNLRIARNYAELMGYPDLSLSDPDSMVLSAMDEEFAAEMQRREFEQEFPMEVQRQTNEEFPLDLQRPDADQDLASEVARYTMVLTRQMRDYTARHVFGPRGQPDNAFNPFQNLIAGLYYLPNQQHIRMGGLRNALRSQNFPGLEVDPDNLVIMDRTVVELNNIGVPELTEQSFDGILELVRTVALQAFVENAAYAQLDGTEYNLQNDLVQILVLTLNVRGEPVRITLRVVQPRNAGDPVIITHLYTDNHQLTRRRFTFESFIEFLLAFYLLEPGDDRDQVKEAFLEKRISISIQGHNKGAIERAERYEAEAFGKDPSKRTRDRNRDRVRLYKGLKVRESPTLPCLLYSLRRVFPERWGKHDSNLLEQLRLEDPKLLELGKSGKIANFLDHLRQPPYQIVMPLYIPSSNYFQKGNHLTKQVMVFRNKHTYIVPRDVIEKEYAKKRKENVFVMRAYSNETGGRKRHTVSLYLDIEAYLDEQNRLIPYLIVVSCRDAKYCVQEWGRNCMLNFRKGYLEQISHVRNTHFVFWAYNGAKFDYLYLLPYLIGPQVKIFGTPTCIKGLAYKNLRFYDLKLLIPLGSLANQGKVWNLPQELCKQNYEIAGKNEQDFIREQGEIKKYCLQDTLATMAVHETFCGKVAQLFPEIEKSQVLNLSTCPQLSLKVFSLYLAQELIGTEKDEIHIIERSSYYGGVCYHVRKQVAECHHYDINSSYPASMKYPMPVKMLRRETVAEWSWPLQDTSLYLTKFSYTRDTICAMTPQRADGKLHYTLEIAESWRWGSELNFLHRHDRLATIEISQVIVYEPGKIMEKFVDTIYEEKKKCDSNGKSEERTLYKLILNSLYGKFGQRAFPNYKLISKEDFAEQCVETDVEIEEIKEMRDIDGKVFFYVKARDDTLVKGIGSLVRIASFIACQSRILLFEGVYSLGDQHVCYMDTDSIFSDIDAKGKLSVGEELGQWKLEDIARDCFFFGPKMYEYRVNSNKTIVKMKGVTMENENVDALKTTGEWLTKSRMIWYRHVGGVVLKPIAKIIKLMDSRRVWAADGNSSTPKQMP